MENSSFDIISLSIPTKPNWHFYGTVDEVDIQWPSKSNQVLHGSEETEKNVNISRPWYL